DILSMFCRQCLSIPQLLFASWLCCMGLSLYVCHSQDCGFGDGGEGVCILCEEGKFSTETGVAPCRRCTQCRLLNRLEEAACSPTTNALCGRCLPGSVIPLMSA
uniref:TNFR-Cys domain-containing protein n=1 Tax=Amphiprion ocellaris TaxID=80972 RepID=A0A3Q1DEM5_AMPOC